MTYFAWRCVQRFDLWRGEEKRKRTETFMRQTGQATHVDIGPWNFAYGVMSGK